MMRMMLLNNRVIITLLINYNTIIKN